jgi:hypothetical protein
LTKSNNDLFIKLSIIQILSLNKEGLEIGKLSELVNIKETELKKILKSMIMIGVYPYDPMSYLEIELTKTKVRLILSQDIHKFNQINFQEGEVLRNLILASSDPLDQIGFNILNKLNKIIKYNINPESESIALLIQKSIHDKKQISLIFHNSNTPRYVDPWLLIKKGEGYLVGYCHLKKEERIFRIDKIKHIEIQEQSISIQCPNDKRDFNWNQSNRILCKIAFHPEEKESIQSIFHPESIEIFKNWLSCEVIIYNVEYLFTILKRFGSRIFLISPEDLSNEFYSQIKKHHLAS